MQKIAAVFGKPPISALLNWKGWLFWVAVLTIVVLVVVLVLVFKRKRSPQPDSDVQADKDKPLPVSTLLNIWKTFLRGIPQELRRSIRMYTPFVVFGESGVGKSCLIDVCTDWQGQARQFYPSYPTDPQLQIYLGSRIVVQEIPAALLNDTSKLARATLKKLWKPYFRKNEPTAVVVLNGAALQAEHPDSLKKQAQMVRGKINIISNLYRRPVKVCMALTHMDRREGFNHFSGFLRQNNIPLEINIESTSDLQNLTNCLQSYEAYLSRALTTEPADSFLGMTAFLSQAPALFEKVSFFIKILQDHDPLSPTPVVVRLSLTAKQAAAKVISNPFVPRLSANKARRRHPFRTHQLVAAALLVGGLAYLGSGYWYERHLLGKIVRQAAEVQSMPPPLTDYTNSIHRLFGDIGLKSKSDFFSILIPSYFPNVREQIRDRLIHTIRESYLFKLRTASVRSQNVPEQLLLLDALLLSSGANELGNRLLVDIGTMGIIDWASELSLPQQLIIDYVTYNDNRWRVGRYFNNLAPAAVPAEDPDLDLELWQIYFRRVSRIYNSPLITKINLEKIQTVAEKLMGVIQRSNRLNVYSQITDLVKSEMGKRGIPLRPDWGWIETQESEIKQPQIQQFLRFLLHLDLHYPPAQEVGLRQLIENVNHLKQLRPDDEGTDNWFHFQLAKERFKFNQNTWKDLIARSKITLCLREFITHNKGCGGLLFFNLEDSYYDLAMNSTNAGNFLHTGKGIVDGIYTREAFEKEIRPALLDLPAFFKQLPIEEGDKARFQNFIFTETQAYASRYVTEYRNYYKSFDISVQSPIELRYLLTQMQLPASQFHNFLMTTKENTTLDLEDNPYFRPFALELNEFAFLNRIMAQSKDAGSELDKFKAILGQMQKDLEADEIYVDPDESDTSKGLKNRLSRLGQFSLAILRDEENTYLKLAQKWVDNVGMPSQYRHLFMGPFDQAYLMGRRELQKKIGILWTDLWRLNVQPLLTKFPFDRNAGGVASPMEVTTVLHPLNGKLWKTFDALLKPVCRRIGGIWQKRNHPLGAPKLPRGMLTAINNMAVVSETLWSAKGVPQPLPISFKSSPLPPLNTNAPIAVLAYVQCGESSVFGFNQQPAWQKLELEWWKDHAATVGIEFMTVPEASSIYKTISVPKSAWSFFRLLLKSEVVDAHLRRWKFEDHDLRDSPVSIEFTIDPDPWTLFQLLQFEDQQG